MSIGAHYGPHDGTSLLEQAMDNLTGDGKITVVSASQLRVISTARFSIMLAGENF
ncbi:MAG: hypothetical protein U5K00_19070 [Melioribacteraceae bacterium]|nr:hypothetical protein [Melioribacteraceae bacterium]